MGNIAKTCRLSVLVQLKFNLLLLHISSQDLYRRFVRSRCHQFLQYFILYQTWGISTPFLCNVPKYIAMLTTTLHPNICIRFQGGIGNLGNLFYACRNFFRIGPWAKFLVVTSPKSYWFNFTLFRWWSDHSSSTTFSVVPRLCIGRPLVHWQ